MLQFKAPHMNMLKNTFLHIWNSYPFS